MHSIRFPNETPAYRTARNTLLDAERDLRRQVEAVAAQRRELPLGGEIPQDYAFQQRSGGAVTIARMSELFGEGKDTLAIYSYMYGPDAARPCPMCTSILDALDGTTDHATQRIALVAVAKSPIDRVLEIAKERGWHRLRLLSSAGNTYNRDYHAESDDGRQQLPALNVFVRRDGAIRHFWSSELLYEASDTGQESRHVDMIWPLWNLLDVTPGGRGTFHPKLSYETARR
jgi:predicted dithiol-disulfide oxidoreductase (DUF899 family)